MVREFAGFDLRSAFQHLGKTDTDRKEAISRLREAAARITERGGTDNSDPAYCMFRAGPEEAASNFFYAVRPENSAGGGEWEGQISGYCTTISGGVTTEIVMLRPIDMTAPNERQRVARDISAEDLGKTADHLEQAQLIEPADFERVEVYFMTHGKRVDRREVGGS